ncbi:MAG: hypothetical protein V2I33_26010 [Kangiellaceae bacterium]|nr:hypothetical protein [Kangiellaceae bacterium]
MTYTGTIPTKMRYQLDETIDKEEGVVLSINYSQPLTVSVKVNSPTFVTKAFRDTTGYNTDIMI